MSSLDDYGREMKKCRERLHLEMGIISDMMSGR